MMGETTFQDPGQPGGVQVVSTTNGLPVAVVGGINGVAGAVTVADGADVAQGAIANAAYTTGSGTVISVLKGIFTRLRGGQATMANSLPVVLSSNQSSIPVASTLIDGADVSQGALADAAWVSGNGSVISVLKAIASDPSSFYTRQDTYVAGATGVSVDIHLDPALVYSMQVTGTNGVGGNVAAGAWVVVLEGSLDGIMWSTIATHQSGTQTDGVVVSATAKPLLFFRSRCVSVTLGSATNLLVTILGKT